MAMIELVEEGPDTEWLQSRALGRYYRLHHTKATDKYRLDIFNGHNTRVETLEERWTNDNDARQWARAIFVDYLHEEQLLPPMGVLSE